MDTSTLKFYKGEITPGENIVFVFGSNPEGRHGAGAAKVAREQFGAIYGQGEGLQGNAYALPTKDLRVQGNAYCSISKDNITKNIQKMYACAILHPDLKFMVAYRNTYQKSLNGYTGIQMMRMFVNAAGSIREVPSNVYFSEEWFNFLTRAESL